MSLTKPTVHMNGTSAERLMEENLAALRAVDAARAALQAAAPHGRDYYVRGDQAFPAARAEHLARVRRLSEVRAELMEIVEEIQDQIDARDARRSK